MAIVIQQKLYPSRSALLNVRGCLTWQSLRVSSANVQPASRKKKKPYNPNLISAMLPQPFNDVPHAKKKKNSNAKIKYEENRHLKAAMKTFIFARLVIMRRNCKRSRRWGLIPGRMILRQIFLHQKAAAIHWKMMCAA